MLRWQISNIEWKLLKINRFLRFFKWDVQRTMMLGFWKAHTDQISQVKAEDGMKRKTLSSLPGFSLEMEESTEGEEEITEKAYKPYITRWPGPRLTEKPKIKLNISNFIPWNKIELTIINIKNNSSKKYPLSLSAFL